MELWTRFVAGPGNGGIDKLACLLTVNHLLDTGARVFHGLGNSGQSPPQIIHGVRRCCTGQVHTVRLSDSTSEPARGTRESAADPLGAAPARLNELWM